MSASPARAAGGIAASPRKVAFASLVGTTIEWYDFFLYGTAAALVFGELFFPDAERFLNHPKGRVIVSDGRNYVRLSRQTYDLVAVDPAPPIESAGSTETSRRSKPVTCTPPRSG